jgi:hypothetical protein
MNMKKVFFLPGILLLIISSPFTGMGSENLILRKGGYLEVSVHYSTWNANLLEGIMTDLLVPDLDEYDKNQGVYQFHSEGENAGITLRWFPGGFSGSFSVGISWEWNFFNATLDAEYDYVEDSGNRLQGRFREELDLYPNSVHFNLRWELWPRARIHPFLGFGFGLGAMQGDIGINGKATTVYPDSTTDTELIEEEYNLKELLQEANEEGKEFPLEFIPVIQLQLGLRARIARRFFVTGEVAFYNGLSWRGGLAWRL